jgi:quercetin dioxygenase-like cupin family protein
MTSSDRLRQHPEDRLAPPVQVVKLAAVAAELRAEPHDSVSGHRQIAIARHGPVTMILFAFEADGLLKEHRTDGVVNIHVLSGHLQVMVGNETHEMRGGQLVNLAPDVPHSVRALEESEMLLTVHRIAAASAAARVPG